MYSNLEHLVVTALLLLMLLYLLIAGPTVLVHDYKEHKAQKAFDDHVDDALSIANP